MIRRDLGRVRRRRGGASLRDVAVKLDRINVGSIDYGIGFIRGVLSSDVRSRFFDTSIANIEQSIDNMRAAARHIERMQREQRMRR